MHLGEEDEFISKTAQAEIKAALAKKASAVHYRPFVLKVRYRNTPNIRVEFVKLAPGAQGLKKEEDSA